MDAKAVPLLMSEGDNATSSDGSATLGDSSATLMEGSRAMSSSTTLAVVNKQLAIAGIAITQEDALMLDERRVESLAETERVEFGTPAVATIAEAIATSPFLAQSNVIDSLAELQTTFYALRDELPVDVPDAEIVEALHSCFDAYEGDTAEVATLPKEEVMAFSEEYLRLSKTEERGGHRIVDEDGRVYAFDSGGRDVDEGYPFTFNPNEWNYDEQAAGWGGERWSDGWND